MTDREKLIELIGESLCNHLSLSCKLAENIAADLIANGVTFATDKNVGTWIPVTERLPDTFGEYIVAVIALDGTVYSDYADFDPFAKRWTTGLYRCPKEEVTHWMPLPEPPKEVE